MSEYNDLEITADEVRKDIPARLILVKEEQKRNLMRDCFREIHLSMNRCSYETKVSCWSKITDEAVVYATEELMKRGFIVRFHETDPEYANELVITVPELSTHRNTR
jgi:hypothetical protein